MISTDLTWLCVPGSSSHSALWVRVGTGERWVRRKGWWGFQTNAADQPEHRHALTCTGMPGRRQPLFPLRPTSFPSAHFSGPDVPFPATWNYCPPSKETPPPALQLPKQHFLARSVPLAPSPPWLISLARVLIIFSGGS